MGKLSKAVVFGLLWTTFAAVAFGATGAAAQSVPEPAVYALTGAGLILLGALRRRRQD